MTKSERIQAVLSRLPVDRVPVSFWRHAPEVDHTARGLAGAMLDFHRRWDLDFIKVMSSGRYASRTGLSVAYLGSPIGAKECTQHAVQSLGDWARIKPLDPGAGALGRELEAIRLIRQGRHDDAPILHTVFSPLTVARKLAGDRVRGDLRAAPEAVGPALEAIAETMSRHSQAASRRAPTACSSPPKQPVPTCSAATRAPAGTSPTRSACSNAEAGGQPSPCSISTVTTSTSTCWRVCPCTRSTGTTG